MKGLFGGPLGAHILFNSQVPWGTRQIDVHKECIFVLSCHDVDGQVEYKLPPSSVRGSEDLSLKSQQVISIIIALSPT